MTAYQGETSAILCQATRTRTLVTEAEILSFTESLHVFLGATSAIFNAGDLWEVERSDIILYLAQSTNKDMVKEHLSRV